jgi:hypothetical protein
MNLRDMYRSATAAFNARKHEAIIRIRARGAAERANAARELLADDLAFHGLSSRAIAQILAERAEEEEGYRSCIGEDFPGDL